MNTNESPEVFQLQDMHCGGCARAVTRAVKVVDPQAELDIDVAARRLSVRGTAARTALLAALAAAGFPASR